MNRALRKSGSTRPAVRRASTMIEFAFILPMFMFMLLFSLDMGHLVLMKGAMADATFSAARTGAQLGGAGYNSSGSLVCSSASGTQVCTSGSTYASLKATIAQIPGYKTLVNPASVSMSILSGAVCANDAVNDHVAITSTMSTDLITPGLSAMLSMVSGGSATTSDKGWVLSATAVARCEIIRS